MGINGNIGIPQPNARTMAAHFGPMPGTCVNSFVVFGTPTFNVTSCISDVFGFLPVEPNGF